MIRASASVMAFLLIFTNSGENAFGQHSVQPSARYYHILGLVHLLGSGKPGDQIRPEYVPAVAVIGRAGILAWKMQLTDDKSMAIIHLVAANHSAFKSLLSDQRPEILVFEPGKQTKATIETALQKYRKDFTMANFEVVAQ